MWNGDMDIDIDMDKYGIEGKGNFFERLNWLVIMFLIHAYIQNTYTMI